MSLYSESGEAQVGLHLRGSHGDCRIYRRSDGEREHLQLEVDGGSFTGDAARLRLLSMLWPAAIGAESGFEALSEAMTRGVYLQQDLVRQFVEKDDEQERFNVVSELIGSGRITELQRDLESGRKSWSTATNMRKRDEEALQARLASLESQLSSLSTDQETLGSDVTHDWRTWWEDARQSGVDAAHPGAPSAVEANQALDGAIRQLQAFRRGAERQVEFARRVIDEARTPGQVRDVEAVVASLREAETKTRLAREALRLAEEQGAAFRQHQVAQREERQERGLLATVALRHLGERCPVCTQVYDRDTAERHLRSVVAAAGAELSDGPEETRAAVHAAAAQVAECERVEVGVRATLSSVEHEVAREKARRAELKRMLEELGVPPGEDPVRACEEFAIGMLSRVANVRALEERGKE